MNKFLEKIAEKDKGDSSWKRIGKHFVTNAAIATPATLASMYIGGKAYAVAGASLGLYAAGKWIKPHEKKKS